MKNCRFHKLLFGAVALYFVVGYVPDLVVINLSVFDLASLADRLPSAEDIDYWLNKVGSLPVTTRDIRYIQLYFGGQLVSGVGFIFALSDVIFFNAKFLKIDVALCVLQSVICLACLLVSMAMFLAGGEDISYFSLLAGNHRLSVLLSTIASAGTVIIISRYVRAVE